MKQFNEKPSKHSNLGQDIKGAARHHRDTYETPEELRAKAFKKQSTQDLKALESEYKAKLQEALTSNPESAKAVLIEYEFKKAVTGCDLLKDFQGSTLADLRALALSTTEPQTRELLRKKFNSLNTKCHKIKYRIRQFELAQYFEPKTRNSFTEINGRKTDWALESSANISEAKAHLNQAVNAVQFGNSVPDAEREYCLQNLSESIKLLSQHLDINFQSLGFSFGARGKAGSIATYQDSLKVIAINRHWDGALVHEIGHAVDYQLGLISSELPRTLINKYSEKLGNNFNNRYYMGRKEIFARLFEQWVKVSIPEISSFAQFTFDESVMPELCPDALAFMNEALLTKLIKKAV